MPLIDVRHIAKSFKVQDVKNSGFKNFFNPSYRIENAVKDISFQVNRGEIVGYIGPNGAGKSTTIKMLTGILVPSEGEIVINGIIPHRNRKEHAKQIGVVFGQRSQLWWELPVADSLNLLRHIYKVSEKDFKRNMELFQEILSINEFIQTPVRQLSLGQRMRADIAASLIHNPRILFLDEPTIDLDIVVKEKIRDFIKTINEEQKVTVILTTHDVGDIEKLCDRTVVIDHGELIFDGKLEQMKSYYGNYRTLIVDIPDLQADLTMKSVEVMKIEGTKRWLRFNKEEISPSVIVSQIMSKYEIDDFTVEEQQIEAVIKQIYEDSVNVKKLRSEERGGEPAMTKAVQDEKRSVSV
ncbi:ATP-binding cassette domain-containing protein [Paenibacillus aurantiacus]|uniref:ATP-binding cassette domain-containing protein n=1 Tax=Paenibacillus aurantiacus TaxID=1936118 RepID=A0ABV5KY94_9BACL